MTYRALARTYRSKHFGELIGQDVLVRTLSNAIEKNRIHHAYMFTGVRGVGKTSTARILAKAINYVGPDGKGQPTVGPTDDCPICIAIGEDRHPDVIEIDAASNTGVDDVRQIIENVRYAPTQARYKVFIIDEVHMLSKAAFNALLKTLEEPPPHVVFMMATTEIRKVPVTILSRTQRFDLRRVEMPVLTAHYKKIAGFEKITIDDDALQVIARAADGSVRDGLSIFDQAIAQSAGEKITAELLHSMLGQADRQGVADLFAHLMNGKIAESLADLKNLHNNGADPAALLDDLLDYTHLLTRIKVTPNVADDPLLSSALREQAANLAHQFQLSNLTRVWQMLLKAVPEVANAPQPLQALEMVLIRVGFAATLPPLEEILKKTPDSGDKPSVETRGAFSAPAPSSFNPAPAQASMMRVASSNAAMPAAAKVVAKSLPIEEPVAQTGVVIADLPALVELCEEKNEHMMAADLYTNVRISKFQPGQIQLSMLQGASRDLVGSMQKRLHEWTGQRWVIAVTSGVTEPTLSEQASTVKKTAIDAASQDPAIQAIQKILPTLKIVDLRTEPKK